MDHEPKPVVLDRRKTVWFIGILVLAIGLILFFTGSLMTKTGNLGIKRYQKPSGKFIRSISTQDEKYFSYMKTSRSMGRKLQLFSLIIFIGGLSATWKPHIFYKLLKKIELKEEGSSPASSA